MALSATHSTTADMVRYSHASLFSPVVSTLLHAVHLGYIHNLPGLTTASLKKHPPHSTATSKGHLKQSRQGTQSTKPKAPVALPLLPLDDTDTFPPPLNEGLRTHHVYTAIIDRSPSGKIFTDQTGRFVLPSSTGNNYLLVLYDYDSNYIDAVPIQNRSARSILNAFKTSHNRLVKAGLRPQLHRLDNECSELLKDYLHEQGIHHQLTPAGIHRRNAAERAIQTFKDHLIAGLCSTDPNFPLHLWDKLLPQALLTLNLLRGSRLNPKLSAYAQLHGHYDFNANPIGPPGTHVVVHQKPDKRASWATRGDDAWYLGPAMEHYRCYTVWNWKTKASVNTDTLEWFPAHVHMPTANQMDIIEAAIHDIRDALHQPDTNSPLPITSTSKTAQHKTLNDIFIRDTSAHAPPLRVATSSPQPPTPSSAPEPTFQTYPSRRSRRKKTPSAKLLQSLAQGSYPATAPHKALSSTALPSDAALFEWFSRHFEPMPNAAHKAINPDTGHLAELPELLRSSQGHLWDHANALEWGRLADGYPPHIPTGRNTIKFIRYDDIPKDRRRDITYFRQVTADKPFKEEKQRVRTTAGGDRINYPYEVTTKTSDLTTVKILVNSTISTANARWMTMDISNFYLMTTQLLRPEYARIALSKIPQAIIDLYDLTSLAKDGHTYVAINGGIYGLPQAGRLANEELIPRLAAAGYHQSKHIPGLFTHSTRPIRFCLVVDDFGISYVGAEHALHLKQTLEAAYKITCDWEGKQFCGIHMKWDYINRTVDLSMPGYVERALQRFQHDNPKHTDAPHTHTIPDYGARVQMTNPDTTAAISGLPASRIREVVGVLLYYGRAIDNTMLVSLGAIAATQSTPTELTLDECVHLLNYAASHPDAVVRYTASDMCLWIHTDASYLSEAQARSRAGAFFFLSHHPNTLQPHQLPPINGPIHITSTIMKNVLASAAEAEVGAAYIAAQEGCPIRLTLAELGHPQPATPLQTDNSVAKGIIDGTVKQRRSKAIDMRFYWLKDRVAQNQYSIFWRRGSTNLADYFTKHHSPSHHRRLRPLYLYNKDSDATRRDFISLSEATNATTASPNAAHTASTPHPHALCEGVLTPPVSTCTPSPVCHVPWAFPNPAVSTSATLLPLSPEHTSTLPSPAHIT